MENLTNLNYRQKIKNAGLAIVEFSSQTCGHCRAMKEVLHQIEESNTLNVQFYEADVTQVPDGVAEYEIRAVPTFLFVKNGEVADRLSGRIYPGILEQTIRKLDASC